MNDEQFSTVAGLLTDIRDEVRLIRMALPVSPVDNGLLGLFAGRPDVVRVMGHALDDGGRMLVEARRVAEDCEADWTDVLRRLVASRPAGISATGTQTTASTFPGSLSSDPLFAVASAVAVKLAQGPEHRYSGELER